MFHLRVRVLGPFEVWREGKRLGPDDWDRPKTQALLKLLLTEPGRAFAVDQLLDVLYPDADPEKIRFNLLGRISRLRQVLEPELSKGPSSRYVTRSGKGAYRFELHESCCLDTQAFSHELAQAEFAWQARAWAETISHLERALTLYRGDFLQDDPYEEWALSYRAHWKAEFESALDRLARCHAHLDDHEQAVACWEKLINAAPVHEAAVLGKMRSLLALGRRAEALEAYRQCESTLKRELGVAPAEKVQTLRREIETQAKHDLNLKPSYRLPIATTAFIGRKGELKRIAGCLKNADCRLLALVGLGGIGKTRLALQAVSQEWVPGKFPDGVCWVSLAGVSSADFLISAVADALEFTFYGQNDPEEQLLNYLREKRLLLVLDNFEHLLKRVDFLGSVLQQAPQVKLLVTSRERLNLQEEWLVDVAGLAFPPPEGSLSKAKAFDAVQMFVERVNQINGRKVDSSDVHWISKICQKVEGMPLAIELTAAWTRAMGCQSIYEALVESLDSISSLSRNMPMRHRSIRAVFEHSWGMLSNTEQEALVRLSIFRGGFTAEAAENVAWAKLPILMSLNNKSMVQKSQADNRFIIHSLLGEYIKQLLNESKKEIKETQRHFLTYWRKFLRIRKDALLGSTQDKASQEIKHEIENVRYAWKLAISLKDTHFIFEVQKDIFWYFMLTSDFQEALICFEEARKNLPFGDDNLLLNLKMRIGYFKFRIGLLDEAESLLTECFQLINDDIPWEKAFIYLRLAQINRLRRNYESASRLLWNACGALRATGRSLASLEDQFILANIYNEKAVFYHSIGNFEKSTLLHNRGYKIWSKMGCSLGIALTLNNLGVTAFEQGEYKNAKKLIQESLRIEKVINNKYGISLSLKNLGQIANSTGEYDDAISVFNQCLQVEALICDQWAQARSFLELGLVYLNQEKPREAIDFIKKGLACNKQVNDKWTFVWSLVALGKACQQLLKMTLAHRLFVSAFNIATGISQPRGILEARIGLAQTLMYLGAPERAIFHLQKALEFSSKVGHKPITLEILSVIAKVFIEQSKLPEACRILSIVQSHYACTQFIRDKADNLMLELEMEIPQKLPTADAELELNRLLTELKFGKAEMWFDSGEECS